MQMLGLRQKALAGLANGRLHRVERAAVACQDGELQDLMKLFL